MHEGIVLIEVLPPRRGLQRWHVKITCNVEEHRLFALIMLSLWIDDWSGGGEVEGVVKWA